METQKRITPQMVKEAYQKTGLKPVRGQWTAFEDGRQCGCGLTALLCSSGFSFQRVDEFTNEKALPIEYAADRLLLDRNYATGFVGGFDGKLKSWYTIEEEPGYLDGAEVAAAIFGEQP